jgi:hypothetical protein
LSQAPLWTGGALVRALFSAFQRENAAVVARKASQSQMVTLFLRHDRITLPAKYWRGDPPQVATKNLMPLGWAEVGVEDFRKLGRVRAAGAVSAPYHAVGVELGYRVIELTGVRIGAAP